MRYIPKSPQVIEMLHKRKIKTIRLFVLFFILFISIIFTASFFSSNENIVINKVEVTGAHIIDTEDIQKSVFENLDGKYVYLFSKANSFIYPHRKIYNDLLLSFPMIETLSVSKSNINTLNIDIKERVGSYLYCGENIPEDTAQLGENCYFVNNDGFIFDKAPYFSGNVYFKYYIKLEGGQADPLGKQVLNIDQFHNLARFIDGVTSLGLKPIYITEESDNRFLYLEHKSSATMPKIMFKNSDDLDMLLDNLSLSMKKKEFADEVNLKYDKLLYLDLRFKNKVLYKFE